MGMRSNEQTGLEKVQFLELSLQYQKTRSRTEEICAPLQAEDAQIQSMVDVSPPKWHLAHTTWFFENFVLSPLLSGYRRFHPDFHFLFNSYYKGQGEHFPRNRRGLLSRPSLDEIRRFREQVDSGIFRLLSSGLEWGQVRSRIELGLHHEEQHQELLLTDIKHILGGNPLRPAYRTGAERFSEHETSVSFVDFKGGVQKAGWSGDGFCFDNELPEHSVYLAPFSLASHAVSQGEYLEFMEAGGYRNPLFWLSDGWDHVEREGWSAPLYWEMREGRWWVYALSGLRSVCANEPVRHLSFYEADAYARWKGCRLPSEFEWEHAVRTQRENFQGLGEVWEWTSSAYLPYPGFHPFKGEFSEYNGKFMSGQMVLRGGSIASPAGHVRHSYRNFFPPSARWQFSGLRLAR